MLGNDDILNHSLYCLRWHRKAKYGDAQPFDVFTRLLAKNIRPPGWTDYTHLNIQYHQVRSRKEEKSTADLAKITRHAGVDGEDFDCPIIIAEYQGIRLLDGNHRINRWVRDGDTTMHDVHIHTIDGTADFVELLPVIARGV